MPTNLAEKPESAVGAFDDLIPAQPDATSAVGAFDDLIPKAESAAGAFDDLIPDPAVTAALKAMPTLPDQREDADAAIKGLRPKDALAAITAGKYLGPLKRPIGQTSNAVGQMFSYAGDVARAVPADVAALTAGVEQVPEAQGNILEALQQDLIGRPSAGEPVKRRLPIDAVIEAAGADAKERGDFPTAATLGQVSQGVAKTVPKIAALSLAGPSAGAQALSAGALFGLDDQGNFHPSEGIIMAALPGVGKVAREQAAEALALAISRGATRLENPVAQKLLEEAGHQAGLNAFMFAANSPELVRLQKENPEEFRQQLAEITGTNLAFALLGVKNWHQDIPSRAQVFIRQHAEDFSRRTVQRIAMQELGAVLRRHNELAATRTPDQLVNLEALLNTLPEQRAESLASYFRRGEERTPQKSSVPPPAEVPTTTDKTGLTPDAAAAPTAPGASVPAKKTGADAALAELQSSLRTDADAAKPKTTAEAQAKPITTVAEVLGAKLDVLDQLQAELQKAEGEKTPAGLAATAVRTADLTKAGKGVEQGLAAPVTSTVRSTGSDVGNERQRGRVPGNPGMTAEPGSNPSLGAASFLPGKRVTVQLRAGGKEHFARIVQAQPDGSATVVLENDPAKIVRSIPADRIFRLKTELAREAKAAEIESLPAEQREQVKADAEAFNRLFKQYGPQMGWFHPDALGESVLQSQGIQNAEHLRAGMGAAMRDIGMPGAQLNSVVERAAALPKLKDFLERKGVVAVDPKQAKLFLKDVGQQSRGTEALSMDELQEGATFKLKGAKFTVRRLERDAQGNVTHIVLDDGKIYSTQEFFAEHPLRMDKGTLRGGIDPNSPFAAGEFEFTDKLDKEPSQKENEVANEKSNARPAMAEGPPRRDAERAATDVGEGAPADADQRRIPEEIDRQSQRLIRWAEASDALLPEDYFRGLEKHPGTTAEHEVFYRAADNRAVKRTYPGSYGVAPRANGPGIGATPSFYLKRMELMNQVFDADLRFEGVQVGQSMIVGKAQAPSIVISQPWIDALDARNPHPTAQQISDFMSRLGFERNPDGYYEWNRAADGMRVMDARPDNFILSKRGVEPIDLVVDQPGRGFQLDRPESVTEQNARAQREAKAKADADALAERKAYVARGGERLTGSDIDTTKEMFGAEVRQDKAGQGSLFSKGESTFSPRVALSKPIKGPTGASIVGYEWRSTMGEKWSEREGGYIDARVSDWDNADESSGTGRAIVHVFYVEHPDGKVRPEGIRSAQTVLGINETRLMTIAKKERAAQQYRQDQERAEMAVYEKAARPTAQEAARDYRKNNYSPMRSFEENQEVFNESALFEKSGKFIRRNWKAAERMIAGGWKLVEDDPAKTQGTTEALAAMPAKTEQVPQEVRTAVNNWRGAEKRLRRAYRQEPTDIEDASAAREEAEIDFRMLAEKHKLSQKQFDELRASAKATDTEQMADLEQGSLFAAVEKRGLSETDATDAIKSLLGVEELPAGIRVVRDETARWGARIEGRNKITVNAAQISSPARAQRVILEEGLHGVWHDPAVQRAWQAVRAQVTPAEMAAERAKRLKQGLPTDARTIREEAAIARLIEADANRGAMARLLDAVRAAFKRVFGFDLPGSDRQQLKDAAIEFLRGRRESLPGVRLVAQNAITHRNGEEIPVEQAMQQPQFAAGEFEPKTKGEPEAEKTPENLKAWAGATDPNIVHYHAGVPLPKFADRKMSELDRATGNRSAKNQKSFDEARKAQAEINKLVPSDRRQTAVSVYAEAGGDMAKLAHWEANAKQDWMRHAARDAQNLSPTEIALANKVRSLFDLLERRGQHYDILRSHRDNYIPHVWDVDRGARGLGFRMLKQKFQFAKARTFDTLFDGDQAGFKPKTAAIGKLLPAYLHEMNKVVADRQFVQELAQAKASDGRPLVIPRGYTKEVPDAQQPLPGYPQGKAYLVFPKGLREAKDAQGDPIDQGDYRVMENQPALNDWRWQAKDDQGNPILMQSDLSVHPEAYQRIHAMLGESALKQWARDTTPGVSQVPKAVFRVLDKSQAVMKREMFGLLAPFHQVQEGTHAVGHLVNPFWGLEKIDLSKPNQMDAARHGLMLLPDSNSARSYLEGVGTDRSLVSRGLRATKIGTPLAELSDAYQDYLFHSYIPALKLKTYEAMVRRYTKRYAPELQSGAMTMADVKITAAMEANAAYGHLNYAMLNRNPTMQHLLRLGLLAPDFLEARTRFTGQAIKGLTSKTGKEQIKAIAVLAATQAGAAFIISQLLGDDYDPKHPFEVIHNGRRYTLRSVPEDIFALAKDTRKFLYARVNPLTVRGAVQYATGKNYRGENVSALDTTEELLAGYIPITARQIPGLRQLTETSRNAPVSPLEQLAGSLGLRISRYSPISETYKLGKTWMKEQGIPEDRGSYPVSKYQQLRYALEDGDLERGKAEYDKLAKTMKPIELAKGFHASVMHPFTTSAEQDRKFAASLKGDDRAMYDHAVEVRKGIIQKFNAVKNR